ncbi:MULTISPECIES: xylulokinase [Spirosoma]|uniref:FGGY family carbohydrate kinase n=1 Tax=Spirosoma liriopis TaxID=2937440 RepID=A0ABT0HH57_9BACT|nr:MULTISPECIES: FGGY family carbohydrate kinase [Spirosoma]MCK8491489.1 FGGY family carbohydrate kinase [Spirosoma liriopis]UHG90855.1 carbohydrate kinase [Spirosoma oryzicola]
MYFIGFDLGSSSVKASLVNAESGTAVASAFFPQTEMAIEAPQPGFAEQQPENWWINACLASKSVLQKANVRPEDVKAIGISYQMHGLVVVDKAFNVLRPSIIWCDSRAVPFGNRAFDDLGHDRTLQHLLNSPGNFTAAKLAWVKANEPDVYAEVHKFMLPGDYLAARMTGEIVTTASGLSEGVLWDFQADQPAQFLLDYYGFDSSLMATLKPTFAPQGELTASAASELGLAAGTPVTYRAGDQPNNAFSLNVLEPGQIAATAGTSGVVYGVSDQLSYDPKSRVNTFLHVSHTSAAPRYGVLMCVNGTGILNSWLRNQVLRRSIGYDEMNVLAHEAPVGADGLICLPFGNGAERILENADLGASFHGLQLTRHGLPHFIRAAQEGIVFAFYYGIQVMESVGVGLQTIRAGEANMFLSPLFRDTLANLTGAAIELYNTDGAQGAARGAGLGLGYYKNAQEAFAGLHVVKTIEPDMRAQEGYRDAYGRWLETLARS